ncbi:MAG TPA: trehalose-6-phosphate synthase [Chloroflexaceae bacterium]|nr:trehalose-6-phosphate synthase [Chloroflexaceae bacterium]
MLSDEPTGRLLVASNRLPISLRRDPIGEWQATPSAGGLVTALNPVLQRRGGVWIGWHGATAEEGGDELRDLGGLIDMGYALAPISLSDRQRDHFYLGFANEAIWPLFHDLPTRCTFNPDYWTAYREVNRAFALAIRDELRPDDTVWVHDYHLMHVAADLAALGAEAPTAFFLHIPFPPPDIFLKLPWREQVLEALLDYGRLGFQTARDLRNFVESARVLLPRGAVRGRGRTATVRHQGRTVSLGAYPIGVDAAAFSAAADAPAVQELAQQLREAHAPGRMVLGVDRLDYTKGIVERLAAFRYLLASEPDLREQITLVQVVVPSRTDIAEYAGLKAEIEQLVGEINGEFTRPGWVPVHYLFRALAHEELLAYYRAADIALITPLKDGMNLVAKEFSVCNRADGALILSEFAGAAEQLRVGALLVNPYDIAGTAGAIHRAAALPRAERRARLRALRRVVSRQDVYAWVDQFLAGAEPGPAEAALLAAQV